MIKKIFAGALISVMLVSSTSAMECTCSGGKMTVVVDGDGVHMSCSDGGRITCSMK